MEKVLKKDIAERLAEEFDLTKKSANEYVDYIFEVVSEELQKGNSVAVKDLGTFKVKERAAREGINPLTKKKITIAAKKVVSFKAASNLEVK